MPKIMNLQMALPIRKRCSGGWKHISKRCLRIVRAQIIAHVLAWGLVAPVLDILIYAEPVEKLFAQGLMAAVANIITTGVVGTLLLLGYAKTVVKKGSLEKED